MRVHPFRSLCAAAILVLLGLETPSHAHAFETSTSMRVNSLDGSVDFCYSTDCDVASPSLTIIPSALLKDTTVDYSSKSVTASTVLADFTTVELVNTGWLSTPKYDNMTYGSVMYAQTCFTGCGPKLSSEYEFVHDGVYDTVNTKLEFAQHGQPEALPSTYEAYDVPTGALTVDASFVFTPPLSGSTTMIQFAVSFLILATDSNGVPTTNVTFANTPVDNKMYLTRIYLGSKMYIDLPSYAVVNDIDSMVTIGATGHTSGDLAGLIEITLVFATATPQTINYAFAFASDALRAASSASPSPSPSSSGSFTPTPSTPAPTPMPPTPTVSSDPSFPRMLLGSRGAFSLCGEADCSSGVVSMGFSGLRTSSTTVKRFANSPAFLYGPPKLTTGPDGIQKYRSQSTVSVPQSRLRPLRPYDEASTEPIFTTTLDQYLSSTRVAYGNGYVDVPSGAIKYSIDLQKWQFASTEEVLQLNMSLGMQAGLNSSKLISLWDAANLTEGENKVLRISHTQRLELPTFALIDGVATPIQIEFYIVPSDVDQSVFGYMVEFTFPAFTKTLYYDPVLRSDQQDATPRKRPTKSWVVAVILLVLLSIVVVVSIILCTKKAKIKLDFSKIIP